MGICNNENCNNEVSRKGAQYCSRYCAIHSKEIRNKLANKLKGHKFSDETKKKISEKLKGHKLSVKTIEKRKQTCIERYGIDWGFHSKEAVEKRRKTNLEKYGVVYPGQSNESIEKRKQTCKEKYGKEYVSQSKEVLDKKKEDFFNSLLNSDRLQDLVEPLFTLEEFQGVYRAQYNFKCKKCNNIFEGSLDGGQIPRCWNCFPRIVTYSSYYEDEIVAWLEGLGIQQIVRHDRTVLQPKELDIYLPEYKVAVEFNGLYWHSEKQGKDRNYHLDKTNQCEKQGIQLIHIFEDEWLNEHKQEIVKSILKSRLNLITNRIYARKCEVKSVTNEEAKAFLYYNHLQVIVNCKYYFGLYHEHALVYLIGISKPRFNKDYQYELVRSCPKINTNVVGGFSKLIKHAVKALNISTMISYVDRRYFTGKGYTGNWALLRSVDPNYFYTKGYERESRVKYQRHKLENLFSATYDKNLTEWDIMQLNGFDRVYDCGNLVFEYKEEVNG